MIYTIPHKYITDESDRNWVDDHVQLMDAPHHKAKIIGASWPRLRSFDLVKENDINDVLYNPSGLLYTETAVEKLGAISGQIEWLPVVINGIGTVYILHPLNYVNFPLKSIYKTNKISKNVSEVDRYVFDDQEILPDIFLIKAIPESAAGLAGYSLEDTFVSDKFSNLFNNLSGLSLVKIG